MVAAEKVGSIQVVDPGWEELLEDGKGNAVILKKVEDDRGRPIILLLACPADAPGRDHFAESDYNHTASRRSWAAARKAAPALLGKHDDSEFAWLRWAADIDQQAEDILQERIPDTDWQGNPIQVRAYRLDVRNARFITIWHKPKNLDCWIQWEEEQVVLRLRDGWGDRKDERLPQPDVPAAIRAYKELVEAVR